MNFLDAHKIVGKYVDAFARGSDKNTLNFRPKSYLNGMSMDSIVNAYKIFYAHTILYGSRTKEQIDQYHVLLKMINVFVGDNIYYDVIKCLKKNTNLFTGRLKNPISDDLKKYFDLMTDVLTPPDCVYDVFIFFDRMVEVQNELYEAEDAGEIDRPGLVIRYFEKAYEYAGLEYKDEYMPFFYSFNLMRKHLDDESLGKSYAPYRDYILENK